MMNLKNVGIIAAAAIGVIGISWGTNRALNSEWVNGISEADAETDAMSAVKKAGEEYKQAVDEVINSDAKTK